MKTLKLIIPVLLVLVVLTSRSVCAETVWQDCTRLAAEGNIMLEGKGWTDLLYDRLPAKAEGKVTPAVWGLSHDSAGMCFRFETDAETLQVRWTLTKTSLAMPHMPATGVSSVDLYVKAADGRWLFLPRKFGEGVIGTSSTFVLPAGRKACVLYLPLYNGIKSIELGVPEGRTFSKIHETRSKPVVVYGTSIAQGGCASRPGLAWIAIAGRNLDVPMINLGFSGSGKMEMEMADLLGELDPSVYVLDCLWNMSPDMVSERMEPFVKRLRSLRPDVPILLVEEGSFQNVSPTAKGKLLRSIYEKLQAEGVGNLHFLSNEGMLGEDGEGTVDGLHPNDLGMMREAQTVEKALRGILNPQPKKAP